MKTTYANIACMGTLLPITVSEPWMAGSVPKGQQEGWFHTPMTDANQTQTPETQPQLVQTVQANDLLAPPPEEPLVVTQAPKPIDIAFAPATQADGKQVVVNSQGQQLQGLTPSASQQVDDTIGAMMQLSSDDLLDISKKSTAYSEKIAQFNPASPDFTAQVASIGNIGRDAFQSTADVTSKFMSESVKADRDNGGAKAVVSQQLLALRKVTDRIAPKPNTFKDSLLSHIPGFNQVHNYFKQYESADKQLQAIMENLDGGKDLLQSDNAELAAQQKKLYEDLAELKRADELLKQLDSKVTDQIQRAKDAGEGLKADALEKDVLFAVRQRHMDVKTQTAVTIQAYMSMSVIRKNNTELIKGVDRSKNTTMVALRTAVIVAAAVDNEKLVLDTLDAIDDTTNKLIANNAKMLQQNSLRIQQRAVQSGVKPETLKKAFDSIAQVMDSMDTFQLEANKQFEATIASLDEQQRKIEPYLERAHKRDEADAQQNGGLIGMN